MRAYEGSCCSTLKAIYILQDFNEERYIIRTGCHNMNTTYLIIYDG